MIYIHEFKSRTLGSRSSILDTSRQLVLFFNNLAAKLTMGAAVTNHRWSTQRRYRSRQEGGPFKKFEDFREAGVDMFRLDDRRLRVVAAFGQALVWTRTGRKDSRLGFCEFPSAT